MGAQSSLASVHGFAGVSSGDGFELAATLYHPDSDSGPELPPNIQLAHVALDGVLHTGGNIPGPLPYDGGLGLTWSGSEGRLVYIGFTKTLLQRFGPGGVLSGDAIPIPAGRSPFAVGNDTVALGDSSLLRLDPTGASVWPPEPIWRAPTVGDVAMVGQGDDAVVAWIASAGDYAQPRLQIAKFRLGL